MNRQLRATLSLRTVLVLFVTAITMTPIFGIGFLLIRTAIIRFELWQLLWLVAWAIFSVIYGLIAANALLKPLFTLRDELSSLANRKERLASLEIDAGSEHPAEIRTVRLAFAELLEALRDENQKRGAFMATLVHDLKTPIIAANHALSAIEHNDTISKEERVSLVRSIQLENETLLALVQKMVDANRFERNDVELNLEPMALEGIAEAVIKRLASQAKERGIAVHLEGAGSALVARKELERALQNLVDNAIRYAQSEVKIIVANGQLTVTDDGAGLPASLTQLSKPFNSERVSMAGREFTSGTGGLGLFIVSRIAELHGGQLEQNPTLTGASLTIRLQPAKTV